MNNIQSLVHHSRDHLIETMANAVEELKEFDADREESEELFTTIENVMYVLRHCEYENREA